MATVKKTAQPVQPPPRPRGVKEVAQKMNEKGDNLSPEEMLALGMQPPEVDEDQHYIDQAVEEADANKPPEWAVVPGDLTLPRGKMIYFIRIPADWTDRPAEGDRQCIAWNLTVADEDIALKRTRGEQTRVMRECAMMMVRAVDGHKVDWTNINGPGGVRKWFDAIGPRGRVLVQNVYARTHSVDDEVALRFFADCFVPVAFG